MTLTGHLHRWSGSALRHIPAESSLDVLDFRYSGRGADNRWNEPGSPTLYLAGDEGVLIAEWGRHFAMNRTVQLQQMTVERSAFSLELSIDAVLDLRSGGVCDALSIDNAPYCFLDIPFARATADFVRHTTDAQALLVPSMGFLDDLERWCLVAFLEKLPPDPCSFISSVTPRGPLRWG
ncbi:MAG: RES family NAD+ phosphorylase [Thermomicrobiales bacterium]|nr:RES family NAD+ phosphorylase [Thermomicrobiales bacterium]